MEPTPPRARHLRGPAVFATAIVATVTSSPVPWAAAATADRRIEAPAIAVLDPIGLPVSAALAGLVIILIALAVGCSRRLRRIRLETTARLAALEESRLAADRLLAGLLSELRSRLRTIDGLESRALEQLTTDPVEARRALAAAGVAAHRLHRLVDDLAALARIESDSLVLTADDFLLSDELTPVLEEIDRDDLEVTCLGDDALLRTDRLRFRQVLRNVVWHASECASSEVRIVVAADATDVRITVAHDESPFADTPDRLVGCGPPEEPLAADSTPLGLHVARSLTEQMDGELRRLRALGWTNLAVTVPGHATDRRLPGPDRKPPAEVGSRIGASARPR